MEDVTVPEAEKKRLLKNIRQAVALEKDARNQRNLAILRAMEAGIPRQEVADAAELHRSQLYAAAGNAENT